MEISKIKQAAAIAKSRTTDKRWNAAIDKAVAGVESGWIVTELATGIMVTTEGGTYTANGACQCVAFTKGQACKHRALARLVEIARELPEETEPVIVAPEITRSVERDVITRRRVKVTRVDGWAV